MSRRNDYDYFDLDNFDDSIDSREYRRRQQQRRPASYAARPSSQCPVRRPVKRRNKRRTRNRIIIVASALIILFVIIFIITSIFKGCSKEDALASVPTGTVGTTASHDETAKSSTANKADELFSYILYDTEHKGRQYKRNSFVQHLCVEQNRLRIVQQ